MAAACAEWFGRGDEGPFTSRPAREATKYTLECVNVFGEATSTVDVEWAVVVDVLCVIMVADAWPGEGHGDEGTSLWLT